MSTYYFSPNAGSDTGAGTQLDPWSQEKARRGGPHGELLGGGTLIALAGTGPPIRFVMMPTQPVYVLSPEGVEDADRWVIDQNTGGSGATAYGITMLAAECQNIVVVGRGRGLEIVNSKAGSRYANTSASDTPSPNVGGRGDGSVQQGVWMAAPGCGFVNGWIHDTGDAIGIWDGATDSFLYGAPVYNNGWLGNLSGRGNGHGIYTQNSHDSANLSSSDSWSDLVIDASDNRWVSSALNPFDTDDWRGVTLAITGGTGFTTGSYRVEDWDPATNKVRLAQVGTDAAPGTAGSTGGTATYTRKSSVRRCSELLAFNNCATGGKSFGETGRTDNVRWFGCVRMNNGAPWTRFWNQATLEPQSLTGSGHGTLNNRGSSYKQERIFCPLDGVTSGGGLAAGYQEKRNHDFEIDDLWIAMMGGGISVARFRDVIFKNVQAFFGNVSSQFLSLTMPWLDVLAATNASPIVITTGVNGRAEPHGLTTGDKILIQSCAGNTAANNSSGTRTWTVTVIDAYSFSLNGSTGNGTYTGSGRVYRSLEQCGGTLDWDDNEYWDQTPQQGGHRYSFQSEERFNEFFASSRKRFSGAGSEQDFRSANSTLDPNSIYHDGSRPSANWVDVRPNAWEQGRGHLIVYNWEDAATVEFDLTQTVVDANPLSPTYGQTRPMLADGQDYKVLFAEDGIDGDPIALDTYQVGVNERITLPVKRVSEGGALSDKAVRMYGTYGTGASGDGGLVDLDTMPKWGFAAFIVLPTELAGDTTLPEITSAEVQTDGVTLRLVASEDITGLSAADLAIAGHALSNVQGSGTIWTLTIAQVYAGQVLTLAYNGTATQDTAGNRMATFSGRAVTNSSQESPTSGGAAATGRTAARGRAAATGRVAR